MSNRGPTFDMDLSDFMDGDKPISYEKARKYFARDPSQRWVSLVLFDLSLSIILYANDAVPILVGQHMLLGQFWF